MDEEWGDGRKVVLLCLGSSFVIAALCILALLIQIW